MLRFDALRRPRSWLFAAVVFGGPLVVAAGCESNTGGEPVQLDLAFESADASGRFETLTGWDVRLEEAHIALGAAYFQQNPALLAQLRDSILPPAHAHPGHDFFAGGEVRAEWLGQVVFDALDDRPTWIRGVRGIAGSVRSWTLIVEPPRPDTDGAGVLEGYRAYVVGEATRDGLTVAFEGGLETLDTQQSDTGGVRFEGLPIDAELTSGTAVMVDVDVRTWLDEADFERLLDEDGACLEVSPNGRCTITADSQVHNAWVLGLTTRRAFDAAPQGGQG